MGRSILVVIVLLSSCLGVSAELDQTAISGLDSMLMPSAYLIVPSSNYGSIQQAINAAKDSDVVLVLPGRYYEHIDFNGKNITVTSINPLDVNTVKATIIDANGTGNTVIFQNHESRDAVLTGFTITGGIGTGTQVFWGGGIYCTNACPTIIDNIITGNNGPMGTNDTYSYGAGICCLYSDALLMRNQIYNNSGYAGAGLMLYGGNTIASENIIRNNTGGYGAGCIIFVSGSLINNTITGNRASYMGSNLYVDAISCTIMNNIIVNGPSNGGVYLSQCEPNQFTYNNLWNNAGDDYFGSGNVIGQYGNISADPLFADVNNHDYHLRPSSPCINAGDRATEESNEEFDFDGDSRVFATRVDIGADEYVGYMPPIAAAGDDICVREPGTVLLDGTKSWFYDSDGVKDFNWVQVSGPAVRISDADRPVANFMASELGEYVFSLVVFDGNYSKADGITVYVGNRKPVAIAGDDIAAGINSSVTLDGSKSYDPDADAITYSWRQAQGPAVDINEPNSIRANCRFTKTGSYVFELTVSDGNSSVTDEVAVYIVSLLIEESGPSKVYTANYCHYPDISGDDVVFSMGSACDYTWDICVKKGSSNVTSFAGGGIDTQAKIDGGQVVWAFGPGFPGSHPPECVGIKYWYANKSKTLRQYTNYSCYTHPAISGPQGCLG